MPFSWIYGEITNLRNALYERGAFKSRSLGAPAVSVGNITVGGTGKTPMVAFIAGVLAEEGEKVAILTRGYGRENPKQRVVVSDGETILAGVEAAGDEPFELARKLLGKALVIADADRVAAAEFAKEKFGVTAFVLDDAFQHRAARRDLDIVLLDATNPFGNAKTLPFGRLREPLENLRRADLIVLTRADLVDEKEITNYKLQITRFNPDCPILTAENRISGLVELPDFLKKIPNPKSQIPNPKSLAFCALGNPESFFEQLKRENFNLAATRKFPDHRRYAQNDISDLEREAAEKGAEILLTTAKDAVKLAELKFDLPCLVVESQMIFDDEKKLRELIGAVFI
jgi:tetraacyldisaccharide 4'-kinase